MHCHPENTEALPKSWCSVVGAQLPHPQALRPFIPVSCHQLLVQQLQHRIPKALFCFQRDGNGCFVGGFGGELPIKWPKVLLGWRFLHSGKPLEPLLFPPLNTTKEKSGRQGGSGDLWGDSKHPSGTLSAHPGHVPSTSPRALLGRQPDIQPFSLLQPQLPTLPECPNAWIFFPLAGDTAAPGPCY